MGAVTYIGNAPNFMVKNIAGEGQACKMPSFFGYMKWSLRHLGPAVHHRLNRVFPVAES